MIRTERRYCPDMDRTRNTASDGRAAPTKTRGWIVTAFNRLVLRRRYETLSVGEVARQAGVGRSTFYEHFNGKDEVLRLAVEPLLLPLADAAVGRGHAQRVEAVFQHIAEQRVRALALLDGPARAQVEEALANLIFSRLEVRVADDAAVRRLESVRLAGAQVALLRAWLKEGIAFCTPARVASLLTEVGVNARAVGATAPDATRHPDDRTRS